MFSVLIAVHGNTLDCWDSAAVLGRQTLAGLDFIELTEIGQFQALWLAAFTPDCSFLSSVD